MGLELYGDRWKHLGRFSSAGGLDDLGRALQKHPRRWPEFNEFMRTGMAMVTKSFLDEVRDFIQGHTTKSGRRCVSLLVKNIASDLLETLERSKTKRIRIGI